MVKRQKCWCMMTYHISKILTILQILSKEWGHILIWARKGKILKKHPSSASNHKQGRELVPAKRDVSILAKLGLVLDLRMAKSENCANFKEVLCKSVENFKSGTEKKCDPNFSLLLSLLENHSKLSLKETSHFFIRRHIQRCFTIVIRRAFVSDVLYDEANNLQVATPRRGVKGCITICISWVLIVDGVDDKAANFQVSIFCRTM